jgi:penicillin amidase
LDRRTQSPVGKIPTQIVSSLENRGSIRKGSLMFGRSGAVVGLVLFISVNWVKATHMNLRSKSTLAFLFLLLSTVSLEAQSTSSLTVKGLNGKVEVVRDKWGVNHIYAGNTHDLFFAQGYCAARDRIFQFEVWRRQATGTVAEILGPRELGRDIGTRLFRFRGDMEQEMNHYHPQGSLIIRAYVEGVNARVDECLKDPSQLPVEFRLLNLRPGKWTPEVVISRHQGLLGNMPTELELGRAVARGGEDAVRGVEWFHPKIPMIDLDSSLRGDILFKDILAPYNAYRKDIVFTAGDLDKTALDKDAVLNDINRQFERPVSQHGGEAEGSNNWVVSPARSASGHALLANDPHRKIAVPSLRYIVHLVAPGWNVIGGGEPEIPGVSIGHNEEGAWGLTIFETDGEDLYAYDIDPKRPDHYRYKGKWVAMKAVRETIRVKGVKDTTVIVRYTVHGPVTFIDSTKHKAFAVRCAWLEPGGAPYLASLRIDQAKTWEQFREACSYSHIPGENMIWADRKGNIGWQAVGITPIRKNFSGLIPVPGDGRYEWAGYLPIKERPHVLNPVKGYFATANQNVTPADYDHWDAVGYTWADPFRGDRINEVLGANASVTMDQMKDLQTDYFSIPARKLAPMLEGVEFKDSLTALSGSILAKWDLVLDKNSIAAGIYNQWERELMARANREFIPGSIRGLLTLQVSTVINRLNDPSMDASERKAFVKGSFEDAVSALKVKLGPDMAGWTYGQEKYKHSTMEHQLNSLLNAEWKKKLNVGPLPRGGNSYTPGSTGGSDNQLSGASFRLLVDTGDWDQALMINTPGQSGDPESPYYRNLFPLWANDQYFPAYYSRSKVDSVAVERMVLVPEKK